MSPYLILAIIAGHFVLLLGISYLTSRGASNASFFVANRSAPWWLVAFGVIGATISGATFVSVPGKVGAGGANMCFSYLQLVLGNMMGYAVMALVLLPTFYRMGLISIYGYLEERLGVEARRTGAAIFMVARIFGSSIRLFLMAMVLHTFVLKAFGIPFEVTAIIVPALIWLYTFKGGTKTVLWTDTLQTALFIAALLLTLVDVASGLHLSFGELMAKVGTSRYAQVFFFDAFWTNPNHFAKQFVAGALIAICTTGLDQDLMQKHLSCRSVRDAQKNILASSIALIIVNALFLALGAALYIYMQERGIAVPKTSDTVFPMLAFGHLSPHIGVVFMMGLLACSYSAADSALTALTTSFCIDFRHFTQRQAAANATGDPAAVATLESRLGWERFAAHLGFTGVFVGMILGFYYSGIEAVLNEALRLIGFTYGPLLGLFAFGFLTRYRIAGGLRWCVPLVCLLAPVLTYAIDANSVAWFGGFRIGFLTLAINGLLTFAGLLLISEAFGAKSKQ